MSIPRQLHANCTMKTVKDSVDNSGYPTTKRAITIICNTLQMLRRIFFYIMCCINPDDVIFRMFGSVKQEMLHYANCFKFPQLFRFF